MGQTEGCMLPFASQEHAPFKHFFRFLMFGIKLILQAEKAAFDEEEKKKEEEVLHLSIIAVI